MPSTAFQSRISAFESLVSPPSSSLSSPTSSIRKNVQGNKNTVTPLSPPMTPRPSAPASPSPSPPNLGRKTSLIDLKDWIVDDGPSPSHTNGPHSHYVNGDKSANGQTPTQGAFNAPKGHVAPLINFESPPKPKPKPPNLNTKAPPLPPRKPSFTSLKSVASSSSLISYNGTPQQSHRSDSLTVDHTYPPLKIDFDSRSRNGSGHVAGSSISSFHSVSLSSDTDPSTPGSVANFIATYPVEQNGDRDLSWRSNTSEADSISLGESYEEVSTSSLASPATERMIALDFQNAMAKRKPVPPKLPQRPASTQSAAFSGTALKSPPPHPPHRPASTPGSSVFRISTSSTSSTSTQATNTGRRPPPPPPTSRSSDRSSIQSTTTSHSTSSASTNSPYTHLNSLNMKIRRPTPVPPAARRRYERVFETNIVQRRKAERQKAKEKPALLSPTEARRTRQAAGWRGLSVDLITAGVDDGPPTVVDDENVYDNEIVGGEERLEGHIIKSIWRRSRLNATRLSEIWTECDPSNRGTLDRDEFVRGMWRIDEELRRAQTQVLKSVSSSSLGSLRGKDKSKPPSIPRAKPILR